MSGNPHEQAPTPPEYPTPTPVREEPADDATPTLDPPYGWQ